MRVRISQRRDNLVREVVCLLEIIKGDIIKRETTALFQGF